MSYQIQIFWINFDSDVLWRAQLRCDWRRAFRREEGLTRTVARSERSSSRALLFYRPIFDLKRRSGYGSINGNLTYGYMKKMRRDTEIRSSKKLLKLGNDRPMDIHHEHLRAFAHRKGVSKSACVQIKTPKRALSETKNE